MGYRIDGTALAFALACSLGTSLLFGLAAVLVRHPRSNSKRARRDPRGARQFRAQNAFVVAQVALAFVLLGGLRIDDSELFALRAVTPGFTHPEWIQTVRIAIPEARYRIPSG